MALKIASWCTVCFSHVQNRTQDIIGWEFVRLIYVWSFKMFKNFYNFQQHRISCLPCCRSGKADLLAAFHTLIDVISSNTTVSFHLNSTVISIFSECSLAYYCTTFNILVITYAHSHTYWICYYNCVIKYLFLHRKFFV